VPELIRLKRYDFVVQFCWRPTPKSQRRLLAEERRQQEAERAATEVDGEVDDPSVTETGVEE